MLLFIKNINNGWRLFKSDPQTSLNYFKAYDTNIELDSTQDYLNNMKQPSVSCVNTSYIYYTNNIFYNNIKRSNGV